MENQHRKIKGYPELNQDEIDLINKIKEHGEKTHHLLNELIEMRRNQESDACKGELEGISYPKISESIRNIRIAKEHLQTGQMWLVRAVALPETF
ncbi:hypothetical protein PVP_XSN000017 [Vibrio phage PVP-XSN]|uniref:Acb2/Tad1 hairpin domain-containing protein n=1 Tax=Vibrio phage PVP-XSN TaxID=3056214 RepID=A0AAX3Y6U7_9CAUD|nr:hypothetical protein PVP_XSN000048 [Vibrio phage PVP-XSN]